MPSEPPLEIAVVGDLTDHEAEITDKLLEVPPGGECILYFDSPGGSPYVALALMNLIRLRGLRATDEKGGTSFAGLVAFGRFFAGKVKSSTSAHRALTGWPRRLWAPRPEPLPSQCSGDIRPRRRCRTRPPPCCH